MLRVKVVRTWLEGIVFGSILLICGLVFSASSPSLAAGSDSKSVQAAPPEGAGTTSESEPLTEPLPFHEAQADRIAVCRRLLSGPSPGVTPVFQLGWLVNRRFYQGGLSEEGFQSIADAVDPFLPPALGESHIGKRVRLGIREGKDRFRIVEFVLKQIHRDEHPDVLTVEIKEDDGKIIRLVKVDLQSTQSVLQDIFVQPEVAPAIDPKTHLVGRFESLLADLHLEGQDRLLIERIRILEAEINRAQSQAGDSDRATTDDARGKLGRLESMVIAGETEAGVHLIQEEFLTAQLSYVEVTNLENYIRLLERVRVSLSKLPEDRANEWKPQLRELRDTYLRQRNQLDALRREAKIKVQPGREAAVQAINPDSATAEGALVLVDQLLEAFWADLGGHVIDLGLNYSMYSRLCRRLRDMLEHPELVRERSLRTALAIFGSVGLESTYARRAGALISRREPVSFAEVQNVFMRYPEAILVKLQHDLARQRRAKWTAIFLDKVVMNSIRVAIDKVPNDRVKFFLKQIFGVVYRHHAITRHYSKINRILRSAGSLKERFQEFVAEGSVDIGFFYTFARRVDAQEDWNEFKKFAKEHEDNYQEVIDKMTKAEAQRKLGYLSVNVQESPISDLMVIFSSMGGLATLVIWNWDKIVEKSSGGAGHIKDWMGGVLDAGMQLTQ